jgi:hypothetical protein
VKHVTINKSFQLTQPTSNTCSKLPTTMQLTLQYVPMQGCVSHHTTTTHPAQLEHALCQVEWLTLHHY